MSHFSVAVFTEEGGKTVKELLAPYQENNMGDCPKEYLEFFDVTDEYLEKYENDGVEMIKTPDGELLYPWDERFRKPGTFGIGTDTHEVPNGYERVFIKHKDRYATFEQFMEDYVGYEKNEETGRYGYWENPNKKWDWWEVGGRWSGLLITKDGKRVDSAKLKDIDWEEMKREGIQNAKKIWQEIQQKDEKERAIAFFIYGIRKDDTEESYIQRKINFYTFAVITPDGTWYEKGEMGWWGISSETEEEARQWERNYFDRFIKNADPELTITIVDCHI